MGLARGNQTWGGQASERKNIIFCNKTKRERSNTVQISKKASTRG